MRAKKDKNDYSAKTIEARRKFPVRNTAIIAICVAVQMVLIFLAVTAKAEPQDIIEDIKIGMAKTNGKYVEICDRREAIAYAIKNGEIGDIIVLAGKGHEDYQEIKGVKYPMDERKLIAEILKEG